MRFRGAITLFLPNRNNGLERLKAFAPQAGRDYAQMRNYDLGAGCHRHVSGLSPYIRHRLVTEEEVLRTVLSRHSRRSAEKFVLEVFWRSYWKGWLELRPGVWRQYRAGLARTLDRTKAESGLRQRWEDACNGETGIDAFDHWAKELRDTGYLHNHARMWFASIWIHTLNLPWELGADFFLRHLLDGDPASNTLGWRWVGGLQTIGKTYLARPDNIRKYTENRFDPKGLAQDAHALPSDGHPARGRAPQTPDWTPKGRVGVLLHDDDLNPKALFESGIYPAGFGRISTCDRRSPLMVSKDVQRFAEAAQEDTVARWRDRLGMDGGQHTTPEEVTAWAETIELDQLVTPYGSTGPARDALDDLESLLTSRGITLIRVVNPYDAMTWPHATHGFFRFKDHVGDFLDQLGL
jgi:deoxyribodipyrimidine photo-lyase